tara:strand:- start:2351 stop:2497 length:147 start_codon:yes stop_codon:yes gene_type:complete
MAGFYEGGIQAGQRFVFFLNGLMSILNAARLIHSATWEFKSRVVLAEL